MFSPIKGCEVEAEACDAHLIPEKLGVSNVTVVSEKEFDNKFGARNDSALIRYIRNMMEPEKDVEVAFYDDKLEVMLHQTTVRTKSTLNQDPKSGASGVIQLDHLGEDLKRRVGLGVGTLLWMKPYAPDEKEKARVGLSMLHSSFLTMYHHFGQDYVANPDVGFIRTMLQEAIREPLPPKAQADGLRLFHSGQHLLRMFHPESTPPVFRESFEKSPHPVWVVTWREWSCFVVILRYHANYLTACLLPGFGPTGRSDWWNLTGVFAERPVAARGGVRIFDPVKRESAMAVWATRYPPFPAGN